jgi:endo-1,4-beta-xylanase
MALKRLVLSAATMAILGCSDGASNGASVPPFAGNLEGGGPPPVDNASEPGQVPTAANPEPSDGAGDAPAAGQVPSEGQNPDNVGLTGNEVPAGSEASAEMGAGAEQPSGMEQPAEEPPPAEETPEEPEPVPEEPAPIVRPALDCGAPPPQLQGGIQGCQVNDQGNVGGQDWFLWYNGAGNGCMTTFDTPSGAFSSQWNSPGDFLARLGFWFDETQTHEELGEIGADLKFTRQGSGGGFSYIGIYGWTVDPLVEFYIVEDAFGGPPRTFGPTQPPPAQGNATFAADGGQYQVRVNRRINEPAITGQNGDFDQIFSIRQSARTCGHVSISEHFRQWENRGLNLGRMKEAKIVVEVGGGNGNGSITFTHANVTVTPPE